MLVRTGAVVLSVSFSGCLGYTVKEQAEVNEREATIDEAHEDLEKIENDLDEVKADRERLRSEREKLRSEIEAAAHDTTREWYEHGESLAESAGDVYLLAVESLEEEEFAVASLDFATSEGRFRSAQQTFRSARSTAGDEGLTDLRRQSDSAYQMCRYLKRASHEASIACVFASYEEWSPAQEHFERAISYEESAMGYEIVPIDDSDSTIRA